MDSQPRSRTLIHREYLFTTHVFMILAIQSHGAILLSESEWTATVKNFHI